MLAQGDQTGDDDLQSLLKAWLKDTYNKPGNVFLGLVQRLDRPTRGLMVLAKTSKAASRLSDQIRQRSFVKQYLCVVSSGRVKKEGSLSHYLAKDHKERKSVIIDRSDMNIRNYPDAKNAQLHYRCVSVSENISLLKIRLITGRFHQIRAQLAAEGMPVLGDQKYGKKTEHPVNLALMCSCIEFEHPISRQRIAFSINMPKEYPWSLFLGRILSSDI